MRSRFFRGSLAVLLALAALPAFAHAPFDMPGPAPATPDFDNAVPLPDAQSTWLIYGILDKPGAVDLVRLDNLDSSQAVSLIMEVFTRKTYASFAPSFALIGRGLPSPTETLPFALPAGYGALVENFDGDPATRPIISFGTRIWRAGQSLPLPELAGSPAYVAVWDPQGATGEYTLEYDIDPDTENPDLEAKYTNPLPGDGNEDGSVDIADATFALRLAVGLNPLTPRLLRTLDVSPAKDGANMAGDGKITISDATRLLRRAVGLEPDPFP
jgi:hypothetical protein